MVYTRRAASPSAARSLICTLSATVILSVLEATMQTHGTSLYREKRIKGDIWTFRYRDGEVNRKVQIGICAVMSKKEAREVCEKLRERTNRENNCPRTVSDLV